jgi:hypothetical protein
MELLDRKMIPFRIVTMLIFAAMVFAAGAAYLWRSGLFPKKNDPHGTLDRSIRIMGAVIFSVISLYFFGYGFGLYGLYQN